MAALTGHPVDCGCCAGIDSETPGPIHNVPGLPAIAYRVGTYAHFKESLLARLSSSSYPALAGLGTREEDDLTIALCDALATSLDVLTFYQERIASEHYLRTSTERRSVVEMARLIGYQPAPGVAASTFLAFVLQETPGDPGQAPASITVPVGTRVQSVPGQDEQPQSFETVEAVEARVTWNAIGAQVTEVWRPAHGDTDLYLDGVATRLKPGDAILVVGAHRKAHPGSERWDVRVVDSIEVDTDSGRTRVVWTQPLGHDEKPYIQPASEAVQVFAFRSRAALFGHNAPDPRLMSPTDTQLGNLTDGSGAGLRWKGYALGSDIDLDRSHAGITAGSWVALVSNEGSYGTPSLPGYTELYRAAQVSEVSRTDFGLSGKLTRVTPDTSENLSIFELQKTLVLAESEELGTSARPLLHPVYGESLALATRVEGLRPGQAVGVSGCRQRLVVAEGVNHLALAVEGGTSVSLGEGDSLVLAGAPARRVGAASVHQTPEQFRALLGDADVTLSLALEDRDGVRGTLLAKGSELALGTALETDWPVSEIAAIGTGSDAITEDRDRTTLRFAAALEHVYERATVRINANVAPATHGETVTEILGSGDAREPDAQFSLRQAPLTHVSAETASGRASTLRVRVNDLLWDEVPSLYSREPDERIHTVHLSDDGTTSVRFGDGVTGSRLPTGQNNVRAEYRKGLGVDGNLEQGVLTNLLSRPLGVSGVTNPVEATGGEDPEALDRARDNAPLTVLTLERAVSVQDYADFSRAFAGIDKAHALWVPAGPARGVFITIAGVAGAKVPKTPTGTYRNLKDALRNHGDPLVPLHVENYLRAEFKARLSIKVEAAHEVEPVLAAVEEALREHFGFARRGFGQGVSLDEVTAVAHEVEGVEAAHVVHLYRSEPGAVPALTPRLAASLPVVSLTAPPSAAELLTLSADPLELEVLS